MSEKLLESELLTTNIQALFGGAPTSASANTEVTTDNQQNEATPKKAKQDSEQTATKISQDTELEEKLRKVITKKYASLTPEAADKLAKKLIGLGEPFKKALVVLGFNTNLNSSGKRNPLLAFLLQKTVIEQLLYPGFINMQTFKALYNAVAKSLVADSEFFVSNDYNIIYCKDLYRKSASSIEKYLILQSNILKVSVGSYDIADLVKNKKTFLQIDINEPELEQHANKVNKLSTDEIINLSVLDEHAKLNSLELAQKIAGKKIKANADKSHLNSKGQTALANKLSTASQVFAAIQFLSVNTSSRKAAGALNNDSFKGLSVNQIAQATAWLAMQDIMPKGDLSTADADNLVGVLLGRLQQLH